MSDFWLCVKTLFDGVWNLLKSVKYPGTDMSIAIILIGALCAVISLRALGYVFGLNINLKDVKDAPSQGVRRASMGERKVRK